MKWLASSQYAVYLSLTVVTKHSPTDEQLSILPLLCLNWLIMAWDRIVWLDNWLDYWMSYAISETIRSLTEMFTEMAGKILPPIYIV